MAPAACDPHGHGNQTYQEAFFLAGDGRQGEAIRKGMQRIQSCWIPAGPGQYHQLCPTSSSPSPETRWGSHSRMTVLECHSAPCISFSFIPMVGFIHRESSVWDMRSQAMGTSEVYQAQQLKLHLRRGDPRDQSRLAIKSSSERRT